MGKSLGGTVTANCVAKHPEKWTGLLGLSGAYQLDPDNMGIPSPVVMSLLNGAAMLVPKLAIKPLFDEHLLVSDPEALQKWRDDELCCKDRLRLGYAVNLASSIQELERSVVSEIDVPMLMMYGDADRVVTLSGHELMIEKSLHKDKELEIYSGGYHNLLQEPTLLLSLVFFPWPACLDSTEYTVDSTQYVTIRVSSCHCYIVKFHIPSLRLPPFSYVCLTIVKGYL
jgi:alpha-beta hydrolase superfamily lysophospholipase